MSEFKGFPKVPRLYKDMVVSEKIDGTNGCVIVEEAQPMPEDYDPTLRDQFQGYFVPNGIRLAFVMHNGVGYNINAQSRKRLLTTDKDNYGFANWVKENADQLVMLGPGYHYGEWWGKGIQRGYDIDEKRFSLFTPVPHELLAWLPDNVKNVPILCEGTFDSITIDNALMMLEDIGSMAAPGYRNPEGVMVYHTAARRLFKVPFDENPKGAQ